MTTYVKPPKTYDELVSLLESRHLIVKDRERAKRKLESINYYRLSGYMLPYKKTVGSIITDDFRDGITWEKVYSLYLFDRKLRLLVFDAIERIEIAVRSQLIYQLSHKYGPHWQDNPSIFKPPYTLTLRSGQTITVDAFSTVQRQIASQLHNNKAEVFIKHYRDTYSTPVNPPSWMSIETMYFSQLSSICENLANRSDLTQIAGYFNLPPDEFVSWLHTINYIRNVCAHHARLWNRDFHIEPAILRFSRNKIWLSSPSAYNRKKLYYFLCMLNYLLQTINPTSHFTTRLKRLLHQYRHVIYLDAMDFPPDWQKEPMWKRKKFLGLF